MNRDFKGIWIPREIWEKLRGHPILERMVNHYFFKIPLDVGDWKFLIEKGLAEKSAWSPQDIADYLKQKKPQEHPQGQTKLPKCSWCYSTSFRLHNHHYPTSRSEGGTQTIPICASCHDEYHYLQDCGYTLTEATLRAFQNIEEEKNE